MSDKINIVLEKIEASAAYKNIEGLLTKALEHQWQDLVLSGVINQFFNKYKYFFVNRRGIKIKVRKAVGDEDEEDFIPEEPNTNITSVSQLKAEENRTRQKDRLLVPERILDMGLLYLWLNSLIDKNINTVSYYYNLKPALKEYLKNVSNKGGQDIIDIIQNNNKDTLKKPIKFRLSNKTYVTKISNRVVTLVRNLDETTKKRMVNALVIGIKKGETKDQLVARLTKRGKEISEKRAKVIAITETTAINEYMRKETAKLNGFSHKTWIATNREACPFCKALDGQEVRIDKQFKQDGYSIDYPPAHTSCYCTVDYSYDKSACSNYLKSQSEHTIEGRVQDLFQKYGEEKFYDSGEDSADFITCVNPNAVWAGGESLVGPDKDIGNQYEFISKLTGELRDNHLMLAREQLSDTGYVQLRLSLGLKGKVVSTN